MSSGSGPSGQTQVNWNDDMRPRINNALNRGENFADRPYQQFDRGVQLPNGSWTAPGQRVAPLSSNQNAAITNSGFLQQLAQSPLDSMDAASGQIQDTLGGQYLGQNPGAQQSNPWTGFSNDWATVGNWYNNATNPYGDTQTNSGGAYQGAPVGGGGEYQGGQLGSGGMFSAGRTDPGANQFQGMDNPYFRQQTQTGLEDMASAYQKGTAADLRRSANLSGAFGGSAYQQAVADSQAALGKSMSNFVNQRQDTQYDRSAGMDESRLGRYFQGQQFDTGVGQQSFENAANRGLQAGQFNQNFGAQNFENSMQRGLQANQFNATQGMQGFENAAQRGLQAQLADKQMGGGWYNDMLNRSSGNVENYLNRATNAGEAELNRGTQDWQLGQDRASNAFEGERNRQMSAIGAGQNEQGMAIDRGNWANQMGQQQQRQGQSLIDSSVNDWNSQMNYDTKMSDWLMNLYGRAMGGNQNSTSIYGGNNNAGNILGGLLGAYGAFGG